MQCFLNTSVHKLLLTVQGLTCKCPAHVKTNREALLGPCTCRLPLHCTMLLLLLLLCLLCTEGKPNTVGKGAYLIEMYLVVGVVAWRPAAGAERVSSGRNNAAATRQLDNKSDKGS